MNENQEVKNRVISDAEDIISRESRAFQEDRWDEAYEAGAGVQVGRETEYVIGGYMAGGGKNAGRVGLIEDPYISETDLAALHGYLTRELNRDDAYKIVNVLTEHESEKPLYDTYREGFIRGILENVVSIPAV